MIKTALHIDLSGKRKRARVYVVLLALHLLFIFLAFPRMVRQPGNVMFYDGYDGLKNYYTLASYVSDHTADSNLFRYNSFAYPFGDYIYYTDNTPLFALSFKWFCRHVTDISAYTIPAFNTFIVLNIAISGMLVFFIFSSLIDNYLLVWLLALVLPWVNIQATRLWQGHYNLSYSSLILGAIALFLIWQNNRGRRVKQALTVAAMVLLMFCAFLVHGYYIAILAMFVGGAFFFSGISRLKTREGRTDILLSIMIPVAAFVLAYSLVMATDGYLPLRKDSAMGFDDEGAKTSFVMMFTHYDLHHLAFPVASTMPSGIELMVYLGNIGLFSLAVLWFGALLSRSFRAQVMAAQRRFFAHNAMGGIFFGGLVCLLISLGIQYTTKNDKLETGLFPAFRHLGNNARLIAELATGAVIGLAVALWRGAAAWFASAIRYWRQQPRQNLVLLLVAGATVFLFAGRFSVPLVNVLNPFLYLHLVVKKTEQFRCLSRFIWPFFWSFYVWMMYTVSTLLRPATRRTTATVMLLLCTLGLVELTDYVLHIRHTPNRSNVFSTHALKQFAPLHLNYSSYQAILPIPFYVVGSEDYAHTIDDDDTWSRFTYQLALHARLPLMSCKMSRTPPAYSVALLNMVTTDTLPAAIRTRLNGKPILLAVNKAMLADSGRLGSCCGGRDTTLMYYRKASQFVDRHHLAPIDSLNQVYFYSWTPGS